MAQQWLLPLFGHDLLRIELYKQSENRKIIEPQLIVQNVIGA
jgi:hypothetical protein